ncbi:hypothetical protein BY996DRAFT_6414335 [Phakopsora pachyrhizi]|nr:hypothetical protein BY996DRAFT_6414335 [Phakopsora pachyrhizi]
MVSDNIPGLTKLEIQMRELYQQMNPIEAVKKDIFELKNSAVFRDNLDLVRLEVQCNNFPKQLCSDDLLKKQLDVNSKNIQGQGKIDLIQNDIKDLRNSVVFKDNHELVRLRDENIVLKQRLDSVHNIPSKVE